MQPDVVPDTGRDSMQLFLQQVFNGVMLGSTYAIVALGLTLVFGILNIPNFAHGHLYMLGAYVSFLPDDRSTGSGSGPPWSLPW